MDKEKEGICNHCGGEIAIRNPKGFCDHLHYPENCEICKKAISQLSKEEIAIDEIIGRHFKKIKHNDGEICDVCDKVRKIRWFESTNYEHPDEGECYCDVCALNLISSGNLYVIGALEDELKIKPIPKITIADLERVMPKKKDKGEYIVENFRIEGQNQMRDLCFKAVSELIKGKYE